MARINLLPWREELRKEKKKEFLTQMGLVALLTGAAIFYAHLHISGLINAQNERNDYLNDEIVLVDEKIKKITKLETDKKNLVGRMGVIRDLQSSRPGIVRLFDEMARSIPDGVYFTKLVRKGHGITVDGMAESNARVSSFMRILEASEWFSNPRLEIIDSRSTKGASGSKFILHVDQVSLESKGSEEEKK